MVLIGTPMFMNLRTRGIILKVLQQIVNGVLVGAGVGGSQCEWTLQQEVRNVGVQYLSLCLSCSLCPTVPDNKSSCIC